MSNDISACEEAEKKIAELRELVRVKDEALEHEMYCRECGENGCSGCPDCKSTEALQAKEQTDEKEG